MDNVSPENSWIMLAEGAPSPMAATDGGSEGLRWLLNVCEPGEPQYCISWQLQLW